MPDAMMLAGALAASLLGLGWLALGMDVHWHQAVGNVPRAAGAVRALRGLGVAALLLSLVLCLRVDHVSMAVLVWLMSLAAAALSLAFTLAWRPRWLRPLWPWGSRGA